MHPINPAWLLPAPPHTTAATAAQPRTSHPTPRNTTPCAHRVALRVQYNGAEFHGWESKPNLYTVEDTLGDALFDVTDSRVQITAASRTDAGAHAVGQTVHFDVARRWFADASAWRSVLNRRLPRSVRVTRAAYASPLFDARRSALWRHYRYTVCTASEGSVFLSPFTWHYYQHPLDISAMHSAACCLLSDTPRDMSAFRKANAPALHTDIRVADIAVTKDAGLVHLDVTADWFVYGMMRFLVATLVQVGTGRVSVPQFAEIVEQRRRDRVTFSAPASGLCLMRVGYPPDVDPFRDTLTALDGASELQLWSHRARFPS